MIILKIAWRNIWRNSRRSWVLISSISVGVVGYLGTASFSRGFLDQMVDTTINLQGGHIMVAAKGYHENPTIRLYLKDPRRIEEALHSIEGIQYAPLVSFQGMISSSEKTSGAVINGIDPAREPQITVISQSVTDGSYFGEKDSRFPILIGQPLAQRLNVGTGEKVVLMTSDLDRNINSGAFRVGGIFESTSPDFDKAFVFLRQEQAQNLAGYGNGVSAFTLRADEAIDLDLKSEEIKASLQNANVEVLSWKDRNKLLVLALKLYDFSIVIMVVILFVAIAFSIANAFLMVIYERIYEIGIMMANGVLPIKIRRMLYTEAIFIATLGTLLGLFLTAIIIGYFAQYGLDLSAFAKGLGKFGVGSVVYPSVAPFDVIAGLVTINLIVFLSVLYPSLKASRFEVVDAIRFV
jgi:ABC-type lipoprotein release transport system permease subunit